VPEQVSQSRWQVAQRSVDTTNGEVEPLERAEGVDEQQQVQVQCA
jgi:hypothetical protein